MTAMDHSGIGNAIDAHGLAGSVAATIGSAAGTPAATVTVRRGDFVAQVDRCVRYLAARLSPGEQRAMLPTQDAEAEHALAQLWRWLHGEPAELDDGPAITFAVFDAVVQRVGERLPRRGGQQILRAALLLAEAAHAPVLAPLWRVADARSCSDPSRRDGILQQVKPHNPGALR